MVSQVILNKALAIPGWMSEKELTWLAMQAQKYSLIVEFGCFHGRSTRVLADNIKPDGKIWAVDPWNGDYLDESGDALKTVNTYVMPQFVRNLKDVIEEGIVIPVRGYSFTFDLPHEVDMVFIDGDHRFESVLKDIKVALKLVRRGGMICGHDWNHPLWTGVNKGVRKLLVEPNVEDSIWFIQRS